jgi:hypothetical protein
MVTPIIILYNWYTRKWREEYTVSLYTRKAYPLPGSGKLKKGFLPEKR